MEDDELLESEDQLLLEDEELIISLAKIHSKSHPSTQKGNFPDPSFRFSAQSQSKHNLFAKHLFQQIDKFSILTSPRLLKKAPDAGAGEIGNPFRPATKRAVALMNFPISERSQVSGMLKKTTKNLLGLAILSCRKEGKSLKNRHRIALLASNETRPRRSQPTCPLS